MIPKIKISACPTVDSHSLQEFNTMYSSVLVTHFHHHKHFKLGHFIFKSYYQSTSNNSAIHPFVRQFDIRESQILLIFQIHHQTTSSSFSIIVRARTRALPDQTIELYPRTLHSTNPKKLHHQILPIRRYTEELCLNRCLSICIIICRPTLIGQHIDNVHCMSIVVTCMS